MFMILLFFFYPVTLLPFRPAYRAPFFSATPTPPAQSSTTILPLWLCRLAAARLFLCRPVPPLAPALPLAVVPSRSSFFSATDYVREKGGGVVARGPRDISVHPV